MDHGVASGDVPWDEDRHPGHDPVRHAHTRGKERNLGHDCDDPLRFRQASPAVGAVAQVLAERLDAESAFVIYEEIDFVR